MSGRSKFKQKKERDPKNKNRQVVKMNIGDDEK